MREHVPCAAPRQANCYFSSSDAAFADRYEADRRYGDAIAGRVPLEGGWRIYSSGPGLFIAIFVRSFLGLRAAARTLTVDPVLPPAMNGLVATVELWGTPVEVGVRRGRRARRRRERHAQRRGAAVDTRAQPLPHRRPAGAARGVRGRAAARAAAHARQRRRRVTRPTSSRLRVANLMAQLAYGLFSMTICLPSMQEWGAIFAAGPSQVQLTFSGFALTYGALQLVYGPLSDRQGRRRLLLVGLALAGTASLAAVFATSIEALIAARVDAGRGVRRRHGARPRRRAGSLHRPRAHAGDGVCRHGDGPVPAFGHRGRRAAARPLRLAGELHTARGVAVLLMLAAWHGMPAQRTPASAGTHWLRAMGASYARLMREPAFVLNVMVLSLTVGAFYVYLGGAPLVLGSYGIGPASVGFYIMVPPLSYIARQLPHEPARAPHRRGPRAGGRAGRDDRRHRADDRPRARGLAHGWSFTLPLVLLGIGHGLLHTADAGGHGRLDPGLWRAPPRPSPA